MKKKANKYVFNKLEQRVLELSHKKKLSHIGSCLTAVGLIDKIYLVKEPDDIVILSAGHAALALYVVLEKEYGINAERLYDTHGTHPNRDIDNHIFASSGSLGHGVGIAVGAAIANPDKNVYVLCTDGELAEGSCYEALRLAGDMRLENLRVICNANGFSAYKQVDTELLSYRITTLFPVLFQETNLLEGPEWMQNLEAHYHVMTDKEYEEISN